MARSFIQWSMNIKSQKFNSHHFSPFFVSKDHHGKQWSDSVAISIRQPAAPSLYSTMSSRSISTTQWYDSKTTKRFTTGTSGNKEETVERHRAGRIDVDLAHKSELIETHILNIPLWSRICATLRNASEEESFINSDKVPNWVAESLTDSSILAALFNYGWTKRKSSLINR